MRYKKVEEIPTQVFTPIKKAESKIYIKFKFTVAVIISLIIAKTYTQDLLKLIEFFQQSYPELDPNIQKYIDKIELNFVTEDLPKLLNSMKIGSNRITQIVLNLRNFSR